MVLILESGEKIGVIGYLTTDTPEIVVGEMPSLEFIDEIEAITQEAERLKTEEGVDIIVALGHSGYEIDQEIARQVSYL